MRLYSALIPPRCRAHVCARSRAVDVDVTLTVDTDDALASRGYVHYVSELVWLAAPDKSLKCEFGVLPLPPAYHELFAKYIAQPWGSVTESGGFEFHARSLPGADSRKERTITCGSGEPLTVAYDVLLDNLSTCGAGCAGLAAAVLRQLSSPGLRLEGTY